MAGKPIQRLGLLAQFSAGVMLVYRGVTFSPPTARLIENTRGYYEIQSASLLIWTVASAVKAICKHWCRVLDAISVITSKFSIKRVKN
jgi:hypothetical protein